MKSRIRGLSLLVAKGQAVLASRADDHVCAAEIVLLSTEPKPKEATIEVRPRGDAEDMRVLGVKPGPQTFTLTAATCVEVLPGLLMGVGVPDVEAAVTSRRARLVFKDPPRLWHVVRQTSRGGELASVIPDVRWLRRRGLMITPEWQAPPLAKPNQNEAPMKALVHAHRWRR